MPSTPAPPAGRDDVAAVFGPLDDEVAAEILSVGATRDELVEAQAWAASDEAMVNAGRPLPTGRVAAILEILQRIDDEGLPEDL